ncbi:MAG: hypothetical protein AAF196_11270 [Planctomycetota bacterium]
MREVETRWTLLDQMLEGGTIGDGSHQPAWDWFCDKYRDLILTLLRRRLTASLAAEAVDDFWSYLYEHDLVSRADRSRGFRPFLCGIIARYAMAWSRNRRKLLDAPLPEFGEGDEKAEIGLPSDEPDPAELVSEQDEQLYSEHVLRMAIDAYAKEKPNAAKALCLAHGWDLTTKSFEAGPVLKGPEIAEKLATNANNVHVMLHRARKRVKELVELELRQTIGSIDQLEGEVARVEEHTRFGAVLPS